MSLFENDFVERSYYQLGPIQWIELTLQFQVNLT